VTKYYKLLGAIVAGVIAAIGAYFVDPEIDPVWVVLVTSALSSLLVFLAPKNTA
jgi:phage shock protein PspC (stress-responsive transcriptional regulator)